MMGNNKIKEKKLDNDNAKKKKFNRKGNKIRVHYKVHLQIKSI